MNPEMEGIDRWREVMSILRARLDETEPGVPDEREAFRKLLDRIRREDAMPHSYSESFTELIRRGAPDLLPDRLRNWMPFLLDYLAIPAEFVDPIFEHLKQHLPDITRSVQQEGKRFRDCLHPLLESFSHEHSLPAPRPMTDADYIGMIERAALAAVLRQQTEGTSSFERSFKNFLLKQAPKSFDDLQEATENTLAAFAAQHPEHADAVDLLGDDLLDQCVAAASPIRDEGMRYFDVAAA